MGESRTKIVATIGPASRDQSVLRSLIASGLDVARLNFSHASHSEHAENIARIRAEAGSLKKNVAILADLPGPKVRTGPIAAPGGSVLLESGKTLTLTTEAAPGDATRVSVSYANLPRDVSAGHMLYLADGAIALHITGVRDTDITTQVNVGGELRARQGVAYPDGSLNIGAVTDEDLIHLAFALDAGVDFIAVSFVREASDIERVRAVIEARGSSVEVLAKIERREALANIDAIIESADGIMVARGDLGISIPLQEVPLVQKDLIARANRACKPVITATQMLESMIVEARPTRAEAADVANAILDGTDAVMLSGETARGAHPVESVRVMARIAAEMDRAYPHEALGLRPLETAHRTAAISIAQAAVLSTKELHLRWIVTGTTTGNTARYIAAFRPAARIVALTPLPEVARRMALVWGIEPIVVENYKDFESLITIAERFMVDSQRALSGEVIAITSGMPVGAGGTNVLKVHRIT